MQQVQQYKKRNLVTFVEITIMQKQRENKIMTILVFGVHADSGGALTILKEFHNNSELSKDKNWVYVVSKPTLKETDNIKVLRFPWIKKSWIHRIYFDYFVAPKIVKRNSADEIISLQNVVIPITKVDQTLYVHQSLPFVEKRFKITENLLFWVYQNIFSRKMFKSIKRANKVIVQTNWMKEACLKKLDIDSNKIEVVTPRINGDSIKKLFESSEKNMHTFFYPASGYAYKNHDVIVDAALLLKERGINNYTVIFTLRGDENKHINKLYEKVKRNDLPIKFIGTLSLEQVYEYYSKSILIFPSYIETFGLPMLEARMHKTPVLASDCPFSHEILDDYEGARFFKPNDPMQLMTYMSANQGS